MPFHYRRILVVGATSGIGEALAARFVKEGSKVIVVGRRQENLNAFVQKHGEDRAAGVAFDITKVDQIPSFVETSVRREYASKSQSPLTARAALPSPSRTSTASS